MTTVVSCLLSYYNDTVAVFRDVQGFKHTGKRQAEFDATIGLIFDQYMRRVKAQGWLTPVMNVISSIGVALIIWQGSTMVVNGELTAGGFTAFMAALIMLYNPIKNMGQSVVA